MKNDDHFHKQNLRGAIIIESAYAAGKMLDHSLWRNELPRKITPSDIDMIVHDDSVVESNNMVVDNNGVILFVELSSKTDKWNELSRGQRLLYENLVWAGCGNIKAALCHINPEPGKQIDTVNDIISFSVMIRKGNEIEKSRTFPGRIWMKAVKQLIRK